jgi:hypothetical protein
MEGFRHTGSAINGASIRKTSTDGCGEIGTLQGKEDIR